MSQQKQKDLLMTKKNIIMFLIILTQFNIDKNDSNNAGRDVNVKVIKLDI